MKFTTAAAAVAALCLALTGCGAVSEPSESPGSPASSPSIVIDDRALEVQLREAINQSDLPTVQALIDVGADVNVDYGMGLTPLMSGVLADRQDMVEVLLDAGADLDASNDSGFTALHIAVQYDRAGLVSALLNAGADWSIEAGAPRFASPIHYAAQLDSANAMAVMLEFGVPVELTDSQLGATPLLWTTFYDAAACAQLLVEYGADYNLEAPDGATVLGSARSHYSTGVAEYLESIGAAE